MSKLPNLFNDSFKDFDKFFLGFDDQINSMLKLHEDFSKTVPNYPPFNVRKNSETSYTIEIAVAGFSQNEIDVEIADGKLIVKGNVSSQESNETPYDYVWKGIANRAFTRTWFIGDKFEVKDAEMFNGMLKIALDHLVPEEKKAKKVPVKTKGQKQYLTEEDTRDAI